MTIDPIIDPPAHVKWIRDFFLLNILQRIYLFISRHKAAAVEEGTAPLSEADGISDQSLRTELDASTKRDSVAKRSATTVAAAAEGTISSAEKLLLHLTKEMNVFQRSALQVCCRYSRYPMQHKCYYNTQSQKTSLFVWLAGGDTAPYRRAGCRAPSGGRAKRCRLQTERQRDEAGAGCDQLSYWLQGKNWNERVPPFGSSYPASKIWNIKKIKKWMRIRP